jgi:hypothetical protein
MSLRTFDKRFALFRASCMFDRNLESSRRCSWRISRWRERLFCFSAEDVSVDSESRSLDSCDMRVSRYGLLIIVKAQDELLCTFSSIS